MLSGKRTAKQVKFIISYQIFYVCNQTGKNLLNISTFYLSLQDSTWRENAHSTVTLFARLRG
jgi:hypothetical protein